MLLAGSVFEATSHSAFYTFVFVQIILLLICDFFNFNIICLNRRILLNYISKLTKKCNKLLLKRNSNCNKLLSVMTCF